MVQARLNVQLTVRHVMGNCNPLADALSRIHMSKSGDCIDSLLSKGYKQYTVDYKHYYVDNY